MFEDLIARLQFWRAKKFVKHGKDYEFFLDLSNETAMAVKFLTKYPDVIVEYTDMHMSSGNHMSYDISIIANPNLYDVESNKFKNFTMDVFRSIINDSINYAKEKNLNETRDTYSLELDSERSIHEEVAPISEDRVPDRKPRKKAVRGNKKIRSKV